MAVGHAGSEGVSRRSLRVKRSRNERSGAGRVIFVDDDVPTILAKVGVKTASHVSKASGSQT